MSRGRFKSKETVIAYVKLGRQTKASNQVVTFERYSHDRETINVSCGNTNTWVPTNDVYKFIQIKPKEVDDFGKANLDALIKLIQDAAVATLNEDMKINVDRESMIITLCGGALTIQPSIVETKRIGTITEVPGWSILEWRHLPATQDEPEDATDYCVAKAANNWIAAREAIKAIFDLTQRNYWEHLGEIEFAKQLEQDPDCQKESSMWDSKFNATHKPTGFRCIVERNEGDRCFCNFGDRQNPYTYVMTNELTFDS